MAKKAQSNRNRGETARTSRMGSEHSSWYSNHCSGGSRYAVRSGVPITHLYTGNTGMRRSATGPEIGVSKSHRTVPDGKRVVRSFRFPPILGTSPFASRRITRSGCAIRTRTQRNEHVRTDSGRILVPNLISAAVARHLHLAAPRGRAPLLLFLI